MTSAVPAAAADAPDRSVPEHLVDMLAGNMRPPSPYGLPPGSAEAVRSVAHLARVCAQRIWDEAWHGGAVWAMSRAPLQIEVTAEKFQELTGQADAEAAGS